MLQEVVVTGTLIKRADFDTPSPLQVLSAEDLQNTGYTSISDVLRTLSANGQETLTQTNPFFGWDRGPWDATVTVNYTSILNSGKWVNPLTYTH